MVGSECIDTLGPPCWRSHPRSSRFRARNRPNLQGRAIQNCLSAEAESVILKAQTSWLRLPLKRGSPGKVLLQDSARHSVGEGRGQGPSILLGRTGRIRRRVPPGAHLTSLASHFCQTRFLWWGTGFFLLGDPGERPARGNREDGPRFCLLSVSRCQRSASLIEQR